MPSLAEGVVVGFEANCTKVWLTSALRIVRYANEDIPKNIEIGEWLRITSSSDGVLEGIVRMDRCVLKTFSDATYNALHMEDFWLIDVQQRLAFSEFLGYARIEDDFSYPSEADTRHCTFKLIATFTGTGFTIQGQSDGDYVTKTSIYHDVVGMMIANGDMLWRNVSKTGRIRDDVEEDYSKGVNAGLYSLPFAAKDKPFIPVLVTGGHGDLFFVSSSMGDALLLKGCHEFNPVVRPGRVFMAQLSKSSQYGVPGKMPYIVNTIHLNAIDPPEGLTVHTRFFECQNDVEITTIATLDCNENGLWVTMPVRAIGRIFVPTHLLNDFCCPGELVQVTAKRQKDNGGRGGWVAHNAEQRRIGRRENAERDFNENRRLSGGRSNSMLDDRGFDYNDGRRYGNDERSGNDHADWWQRDSRHESRNPLEPSPSPSVSMPSPSSLSELPPSPKAEALLRELVTMVDQLLHVDEVVNSIRRFKASLPEDLGDVLQECNDVLRQ